MSTIVSTDNLLTSRFDALQRNATATQIKNMGQTFRFDRRKNPLETPDTVFINGIFTDRDVVANYEGRPEAIEREIMLVVLDTDLTSSGLRQGDGGLPAARPTSNSEWMAIESITRDGHGAATLTLRLVRR